MNLAILRAAVGIGLAFALFAPAARATLCFENQKVIAVNTGYVDIWGMGPDGGDAVYFALENGKYFPLSIYYNLDSARGQRLHSVLMTAFTSGFRITGHDHFGWVRCDDIDEIRIVK